MLQSVEEAYNRLEITDPAKHQTLGSACLHDGNSRLQVKRWLY